MSTNRLWACMLTLWASACDGGAATSGDAGRDAAATRASVVGEVRYVGDADGSLLVGAWPWDPAAPSMPAGPPSELVVINEPTFPVQFELDRLRPGSYFVGAVLDVGRDDPTLPGDEDLQVYTGQVDLEAGEVHTLDLDL